ncbi:MAG: cupin domain-containing protein [Synergistaceae bacterium]|nr:cupin domain-containing protein [Synergistaceae bacterium]
MNIILLSGGSGKRLWPLSNDIRSKQFIKIFRRGDGYESMVQRVYRQIMTVAPDSSVTVATSRSQVSALHNQLGTDIGVSVEPCRRDTFPAIALAAAYLHDIKGMSENEAVIVCPVDPYVEDEYFRCLQKIFDAARRDEANLILMGIAPTYPSDKYGYIIPTASGFSFTEKPTAKRAAELVAQGALWNGGVFACKLKYILDKSKKFLGFDTHAEMVANYETLKKISFDYAVVEHESSLAVVRYSGTWKDLGTWNTLAEAMEEHAVGNVILSDNCENVHVINELDIPILATGLRDAIISASPEGIIVSDKRQSSYIKPLVENIHQQVMFAEKSWGSYRVIDVEDESLTVKVTLNPGHRMNYHSHERRNEIWNVISGSGVAIIDGAKKSLKPGDVITMPAGVKHTAIAGVSGLQMVEVQLGRDISVEDKKKFTAPI